ncbi:hypothetical protein ElyMa_002172800 [Elysia marginata]|uniref:Uncharacterized protein n=1 Tax=Elysia marginata TaxID=1093978 RepID=A0AAV4FNN5_9GAST|nr:hypothetical protein ElyMa_002172800 [Elysia marginata]
MSTRPFHHRSGRRQSRGRSRHMRTTRSIDNNSNKSYTTATTTNNNISTAGRHSSTRVQYDNLHRPVIISPRHSTVEEDEEEEEEKEKEEDGHFSSYSYPDHDSPVRPLDIDAVPPIDGTEYFTYKPALEQLDTRRREYRLSPRDIVSQTQPPRSYYLSHDLELLNANTERRNRCFDNHTGIPVGNLGDGTAYTSPMKDTSGQYLFTNRGKRRYFEDDYSYPNHYNNHNNVYLEQQQRHQRPHVRPSTSAYYNQGRVEFPTRRVFSQPDLQSKDRGSDKKR